MKLWISVDVEADGPVPGLYSMVCFGAVIVEPELKRTFKGFTKPLPEAGCNMEALAVSGYTREQTMQFQDPLKTMTEFDNWLHDNCDERPIFVADNNGFDWAYINYYFHKFLGRNPFGFSSRNLGDLYKGMCRNTHVNFKHLRTTRHTHDPVQDAMGNAEALLEMQKNGLRI